MLEAEHSSIIFFFGHQTEDIFYSRAVLLVCGIYDAVQGVSRFYFCQNETLKSYHSIKTLGHRLLAGSCLFYTLCVTKRI